MNESKVKVAIFGEQFVIKGDATPERIRRLAEFVDRHMKRIAERHPELGMSKIAVLTALNLANELFRRRDEEHKEKEGEGQFEEGW